jgi:hypothetical protein
VQEIEALVGRPAVGALDLEALEMAVRQQAAKFKLGHYRQHGVRDIEVKILMVALIMVIVFSVGDTPGRRLNQHGVPVQLEMEKAFCR